MTARDAAVTVWMTPAGRVRGELYRYGTGRVRRIAEHAHDEYQVGYSPTGRGGFRIGRRWYPTVPGRAHCVPPGQEHATGSDGVLELPADYMMLYLDASYVAARTLDGDYLMNSDADAANNGAHPTRRDLVKAGGLATGTALLAAAVPALANTRYPQEATTGPTRKDRRFTGKVVLITGATSGVGEETAKAFAHEGAKVFFNGRRMELGTRVEAAIRDAGGEATYFESDVRVEEQVKAFVDACVAKHGRLDVAFNNAGTDKPPAAIADMETASFDDQIATNLRGVFLAMKYELPHLVRSSGAMINMGSVGGRHAFPNIVGYAASKAAVIHMTRCCAQEYGRDVRVNAIAPGAIDTDMLKRVQAQWNATPEQLAAAYPAKRLGTAAEVAAVVLWLASDAASYVSGQVIGIDGGDLP